MDKVIDTRTLVEHMDEIMDEVGNGSVPVVVTREGKPDVWLVSGTMVKHATVPADWLETIWAGVEARGLPPLTMDEIDDEIAASRREQREADTASR